MFHHKPICDVCHQRVATIFITRSVEGQSHKDNLCESCAHAYSQGEEWLKSMAQKFGLPESASLDDIMHGIAEKMPNLGAPDYNQSTPEYSGDFTPEYSAPKSDSAPDIMIEANLQFSDGFDLSSEFTTHEFPADEDAADDLDEAWSEIELKYFMAQKDNGHEANGTGDETEAESASEPDFGEISYEAMKAIWLGDESTLPQKNITSKDNSKEKPREAPREIHAERCPKCSTTWDRLREDGRAGCAQCYVAFHDRLVDVMNRMQREAQHVGKTPRAAVKRHRRLEQLRARRDHRLEMLNRRLQEAIAGERYEDAAQIRDKIKMVSSTIVSDQS